MYRQCVYIVHVHIEVNTIEMHFVFENDKALRKCNQQLFNGLNLYHPPAGSSPLFSKQILSSIFKQKFL